MSSYRLALDQEVFDAAMAGSGLPRTLQKIPPADRAALSRDPVAVAMALALDSYSRLDAANAIDLRFAILKKSGAGFTEDWLAKRQAEIDAARGWARQDEPVYQAKTQYELAHEVAQPRNLNRCGPSGKNLQSCITRVTTQVNQHVNLMRSDQLSGCIV